MSVGKQRGQWIARWKDQQGKWHRVRCKTQKAARDFAKTKDSEVASGTYRPEGEKLKLAKYADQWLTDRAEQIEKGQIEMRVQTLAEYRSMVERFILHEEFGLGEQALKAITPGMVKRFRAEMVKRYLRSDERDRERGRLGEKGMVGTRTINLTVTVLGSILKAAVEDDLLSGNPARIRRLKEPPRDKGTLTPAQVQKLLSAEIGSEILANWPEATLKLMIHLSVTCGLRRSELLALRWRCVDLERGRLSVCEGYVRGGFADLKTEKSRRVVGIGPTTAALLKEHRQRVRGFEPDGLLFDGGGAEVTGWPLDPTGYTKKVGALLKAVGLPENVTLHSLRHAFASILVDEGAELYKVSQRLGHADVKTTTGVYAHQIVESVDAEAQIIERALFGME